MHITHSSSDFAVIIVPLRGDQYVEESVILVSRFIGMLQIVDFRFGASGRNDKKGTVENLILVIEIERQSPNPSTALQRLHSNLCELGKA